MFASGLHTVVTTFAGAGNVCVVKVCRQPAIRGMTGVALSTRRYMARMFTAGLYPVVTGATGARDIGVTKACW